MSEEKKIKKQLVIDLWESGVKETTEIFKSIADSHGLSTDLSYIRRTIRGHELGKRVGEGKHKPVITKPYATSGITGNPVANEYLKKVESNGGGFLKTCVYDIETTNLNADFGFVLSIVLKDVDTGEHKVFRLDETSVVKEALAKYKAGEKGCWTDPNFWDVIDIELLDAFRKEYSNYNLCITYNGKFFDEMFLNTRMLRCQLPGLPVGVKHMDIFRMTQKVIKMRSLRLDAVKNFLKIDDQPDTHNWAEWRMAGALIKEGLDFVVEHNIKDVEQLHQVAQQLRNYSNFYVF